MAAYQWYYKKVTDKTWIAWSNRVKTSTTATSNATWDGMQVRCVVKDSAGNTATSNAATITLK